MRLSFYYEGRRCRPMLKVGDEPMRPTQANLKYARRLAEEVKAKIKAGEFVMAEYFPESGEGGPGARGTIAAIKHYRNCTGHGLREAKDAVEILVARKLASGVSAAPASITDDEVVRSVKAAGLFVTRESVKDMRRALETFMAGRAPGVLGTPTDQPKDKP